jgi:hypothetical protein
MFIIIALVILVAILVLRPKKRKVEVKKKIAYGRENLVKLENKNDYEAKEVVKVALNIDFETNQVDGEKDAWERIDLIDAKEYRNEFEIEIDYKDGNGLSTTRQVRVKGYRIASNREDAEIWGYCYTRKASRTFYKSRTKRCIDLNTGKVIKDIITFLEYKHYETPEGQLDLWIEKRKGEMDALVYVGRLDGALRQSKRDILFEYISKKEPELNITTKIVNTYLKKCGTISKTMFGRVLTQLSFEKDDRKEGLIEVCSKMIETKKNKNTEEEKIINHMRKRLFDKTNQTDKAAQEDEED